MAKRSLGGGRLNGISSGTFLIFSLFLGGCKETHDLHELERRFVSPPAVVLSVPNHPGRGSVRAENERETNDSSGRKYMYSVHPSSVRTRQCGPRNQGVTDER